MKKKIKSALSLLLSASMMLPMFPSTAMAAEVMPSLSSGYLSASEEAQMNQNAKATLEEVLLQENNNYKSVTGRNTNAGIMAEEDTSGKVYTYKYVRDTDGIDDGKEYVITWPLDDNNGRVLFCKTGTADIIKIGIENDTAILDTGFLAGYQTWKVTKTKDGYYNLQSLNGNTPSNYLDLTLEASSPFVKTPAINEGQSIPTVRINSVGNTGKYTIQGVSGNSTGKYYLKNQGGASGRWITSETGNSNTEQLHFYEKVAEETSALGLNIGNMFTADGADNVWVFTGGEAVAATFAQTKTTRNYIGHYEEYIRWIKRGGNTNTRQRYTINAGEKGRDLSEIVSGWETIVVPNNPKAVSFFLGKEDYEKGEKGLEGFETALVQFITKALELKSNQGFAVIQLPFYTGDEEQEKLIELYKEKVTEVIDDESNGFITELEKYKRIVIVDHHTKTKEISNWSSEYVTNGMPNVKGHFEIGKQLAEATIKATDGFPSASSLRTKISYGPETYLTVKPEIEAGNDSIKIKLTEDILNEYGKEYEYELTLTDSKQDKTVVTEAINFEEKSEYTISDLPSGAAWILQLRTKNQEVQFATMEGTLSETGSVSGQVPAAFTEKGTESQKELGELLNSNESLRWLFVGDSITHGCNFTHQHDNIVQLFEKYLRDDLGRTSDVVINSAVAGAVTADNTNNGNDAYRLDWDADVVMIMLGTNDAAVTGHSTKEQYVQHFETLLNKIREHNPGAMIIFRTPVYTSSNDQAGRATNLYPILEALKEMAAKEVDGKPTAAFYIDQYAPSALALAGFPWLYPNGNGRDQVFGDHIHPNDLGHLMMFWQLIDELGLWKNDSPLNDVLYHTVSYTTEEKGALAAEEILIDETNKSLTIDVSKLALRVTQLGSASVTVTSFTSGRSYTKELDRDVTVNTAAKNVTVSWPANTTVTFEDLPWDDLYEVTVTGWSTQEAKKLVFEDAIILGSSSAVIVQMDYLVNQNMVPIADKTEIAELSVLGAENGSYSFTIEDAKSDGKDVSDSFEVVGQKLVAAKELEEEQEYTVTIKAVKGESEESQSFTFTTGKKSSDLENPVIGSNLELDTKDSRYLIYDIIYEDTDNNPVKLSETPYTRVLYDDSGSSTGWLKYYNTWHTDQDPKYLWKLTETEDTAAYEMRSQRMYNHGWPLYAPYGNTMAANGKNYLFALSQKIASGDYDKASDLAKVNFRVMGQETASLGGKDQEVLYVALVAEGAGVQAGKTFYLSTEDGNIGTGTTNIRTYAHWLEVPADGNIPRDNGWWVLEEVPGAVDGNGDIAGRELLFRTSAMEYHYRIPAIVAANNGNLITAVDYRFHSNADIGTNWTNWDGIAWRNYAYGHQIDLHTRVSKNNGESWEEAINRTKDFTIAPDFDTKTYANGYGDPALVADRESDNVLLVSVSGYKGYVTRGTEASYMLSEDNGATFTDPIKLSDQIYGRFDSNSEYYDSNLSGQRLTQFFFASGKIHQSRYIKVGTHYRIYSAILANYSTNCNYVMYSDDFGKNWYVLGNTTAIANGGDEAKIEELPNGDVVITSRITKGRKVNIFKYDKTDDQFKTGTWGTPADMNLAPNCNNGCNGEVYVIYAKKAETGEYGYLILQSLPTGTGRTAVKIFYRWLEAEEELSVSDFIDTSKWSSVEDSFLLQDGKSCYSTMILQPDGKLGVIWEEGVHEYDIVYKALELSEITKGKYTVAFPSGGIGSKDTPYLIASEAEENAVETTYANEKVNFKMLTTHTVTFDSQGGTFVEAVSVNSYDTITLPKTPVKEGYTFGGWFTEAEGKGIEFTEETKVKEDITLYAKWIPVTNPDEPGDQEENIPEGIWVTGVDDVMYQGEKVTFPGLKVYDGEQLLKEKVDYTVSYKNNLNAYTYEDKDLADYESQLLINKKVKGAGNFVAAKAPQVIIKMKGNYTGSKSIFFNIYPQNIENLFTDNITVSGNTASGNTVSNNNTVNLMEGQGTFVAEDLWANANPKKQQMVTPEIWWLEEGRTLKLKKEFAVKEYDAVKQSKDKNQYKQPGEYTLTLQGKGNFTGEVSITYTIAEAGKTALSSVKMKNIKPVNYTGSEIEPSVEFSGKSNLPVAGTDYTVTYERNTAAGTGFILLEAVEGSNFVGTRRVSFKINGTSLAKAKAEGLAKSYNFTRSEIRPFDEETVRLNVGGTGLEKDVHYTVSYEKNVYKGTATAIVTGIEENGYVGTKKVTFKIGAAALDFSNTDDFNISFMDASGNDLSDERVYANVKSGTKPFLSITHKDVTLREGVDYTLSYKNNKKPGMASVIIKGKGDFSGKQEENFTIVKKDANLYEDSLYIFVKDVQEGKKAKQGFKVYDEDGKALSAKDYKAKEAVYTIVALPDGEQSYQIGDVITDNKAKLPVGTVIEIKVTLTGECYEGELTGTYRVINKNYDISNASVTLQSKEYTGTNVTIEQADMIKHQLKNGTSLSLEGENANIEIVRYENNIKKGTAKVTLKGKEDTEFGGLKTVTFKIVPRTIENNWEGIFEDMLGSL